MQPFLHIILSDGAAKAVCWTLVHSIWEGIAAALLAGAIILSTRKQAAALRYNLLTGVLVLFVLGAGSTFYYELSRPGSQASSGSSTASVQAPAAGIAPSTNANTAPAAHANTAHPAPAPNAQPATSTYVSATPLLLQRTESYLNTHALMITFIWLICLAAQLVRLTGGLYRINRLRKGGMVPHAHWEQRLMVLAHRLGIKRTVVLLQSGKVQAPSAIGFLKPAILLPLGLLTRLSPEQVEAILLHELAHIRRSDYFANLLLHVTEAIFFFNPGVRWIAALIRREREACCDDIVLVGTPDRNNYFEAVTDDNH